MAEDKKSFLLYADLIHTVKKMPKEKAGELLMFILDYVNDHNPETDDMIINLVFEPIKQQMKRDLVKWEEIKHRKSLSGIMGNIKRWNPDLYDLIISGKMEVDEALKIIENRKVSQPDPTQSQSIANIAVNDTVNVNVINKDTNVVSLKKSEDIDYKKFIDKFNSFGNKGYKITEALKKSLRDRLKEYSRAEILKAIENAHKDPFHIDNGFKYLNPSFMLRTDKIEKFLNFTPPPPELKQYQPRLTAN